MMKKSILRIIVILFFVSLMVLVSIFFFKRSTAENTNDSRKHFNNSEKSYDWIVEKIQLLDDDKILLTE